MRHELFSLTTGYFSVPDGVAVIRSNFFGRGDIRPEVAIEDPAFMQTELTRRHEFAHYRQLMSTPLGLLLWRAHQATLSNVSFVATAISDMVPRPKFTVPIHTWVLEGHLDQFVANGVRFDPSRISKRWVDIPQTVEYMRSVCVDIVSIEDFLENILNRTEITVAEFVEVANKAFFAMSKRSGLTHTFKWVTRLPAHQPLHADFTTAEMIEAAARLEERRVLERLPNADERIREWESRSICGVYQPVYTWLMNELGDASAALGILDAAFMAPIDLAFARALAGGSASIEEMLPVFRLKKLVAVAKDEFWPHDAHELDKFLGETLCVKAGLITPRCVARHGVAAKYSGDGAWDFDYKAAGLPAEGSMGQVYDYAQAQVKRAMGLRLERPSCLIDESLDDDKYVFRPLITFYDDKVVFGFEERASPNIHFLAYRSFAVSAVLYSLLGGDNASELARLQHLMTRRALHGQGADDWFRENIALAEREGGITRREIEQAFDIGGFARSMTDGNFAI